MKRWIALLIVSVLLLALAVGWDFYQKRNFSEQEVARRVSVNLARESENIKKEIQRISNTQQWTNLAHPFFLIDSARILKWNSTDCPISIQELSSNFEWMFIRASHSELLAHKIKINPSQFLVGVIPLHRGYEFSNRFLTPQWNKNVFPIDGIKLLEASSSNGALVIFDNNISFKVQLPSDFFLANPISVGLTIGALILFFISLFIFIQRIHTQGNYLTAFVLLAITLVAVRIAMVQFSFPSRWWSSQLFDPKFFASSSFNASVGDFFLNALIVFVCSAYFFRFYSRTEIIKRAAHLPHLVKVIMAMVLVLASYFCFLFPQLFIESIFHDSVIPFDITNDLNFDYLRFAALLALALGGLSSFFFVHVLIRLTKVAINKKQFLFVVSLAAILFVAYFLFSELNYWITLCVATVYFLFLFYSNYYKAIAVIGYKTFPVLVIVIALYATQSALGIWRFVEEKNIKLMFRSANNLFSNDVLGEYLLHQASEKISNDNLISASIENPLLSKNEARQKIKQIYLSDYFNRYQLEINFYRVDGSPADAESNADLASTLKTVQGDAFKTAYDGIYLIQNENADVLKRYVAIATLRHKGVSSGYVLIDLSVKHIAQQQVYPSLLVDSRFAQSLREKEFSYATYSKDKWIDHFGTFNFERDFDVHSFDDPRLYSRGIERGQSRLIAVENESGNRIVLASNIYPRLHVLSNFSFLFSVGILIVMASLIIFFVDHKLKGRDLNYSARIQIFAYSSFVIPLIAVSVIALRMINQSNEMQYEQEILEKGNKATENLAVAMEDAQRNNDVKAKLNEVAQTLDAEMNLYKPGGELLASSQIAIFRNQLTMPLANNIAWEKIAIQNFYNASVPCQIGDLNYNSSYFAIKSKTTGDLLAILEIPFFEPINNAESASVFSNMVTTFAIVFIFFSFISLIALDRLTYPLRFIAKKLNATFLANNQPIDWRANDEMGRLVKEYNRMLANLDKTKVQLAQREKESAWREIAQQVAHEVKNPLTPMKLTLQQLEFLLANGRLDDVKTKESIQMLLMQVEVLNQIATAFNSFATMPTPEIARIDIVDLVKATVVLFENNPQGSLYFHETAPVFIQGDEKLLRRIFANIILNALQSARQNQKVAVDIRVITEPDHCLISFKDNGVGIPPELIDKIFLPHFTTKQSGSGLGLAIAKQGIEQMGGSIWFETSSQGTNFFVRLKSSD